MVDVAVTAFEGKMVLFGTLKQHENRSKSRRKHYRSRELLEKQ